MYLRKEGQLVETYVRNFITENITGDIKSRRRREDKK